MTRWFNTAGPCKPDLHYMLPSCGGCRRCGNTATTTDGRSVTVLRV